MQHTLQLIASCALFLTGCYLIIDLFATGFSWAVLICAAACFYLAYWLKPKENKEDDVEWYIEVIDLLIELPIRVIAVSIRGLGKVVKNMFDGDSL